MTDEAPTFEQAELELRKIVERLEAGDVGVDEAIARSSTRCAESGSTRPRAKSKSWRNVCKQRSRLHRIRL